MTPRRPGPRRRSVRRLVALAGAGLALLAACGGDDDATPPSGGDGAGTAQGEVTPLAELLGWGDGTGSTGLSDQQREQERLVQERVAACMRAQGFDYVPEDPEGPSRDTGPFSLPPEEFAAQYGYGVTTIDAADVAGPEADPNQAILDGLSPQAREAYALALYGPAGARPLPGWIEPLPGAGPAEGEAGSGEDPGCYQEAQDAVYGPAGGEPDEGLAAAFAELDQELAALQERIHRDGRVDAARLEWASCMAEAGHPEYPSPEDAPIMLRERFRELTGFDAAPTDGRSPGVADSAALQALRDEERAVAQADRACRGSYDDVVTEVRTELEEEFIDDHRELLERYRALAGVSGGDG